MIRTTGTCTSFACTFFLLSQLLGCGTPADAAPSDASIDMSTIMIARDAGPDARRDAITANAFSCSQNVNRTCGTGLSCKLSGRCSPGEHGENVSCRMLPQVEIGDSFDYVYGEGDALYQGTGKVISSTGTSICENRVGVIGAQVGSANACDPNSANSCDPCSNCRVLGASPEGSVTGCIADCVPQDGCNPCDEGLACIDNPFSAFNGGCWTGCSTDEACRLYREDTDRNGEISGELRFPDGGVPDGGFPDGSVLPPADKQRVTTRADVRCDTSTRRCTHDGKPGASAGDRCEADWDCEAGGVCILGSSDIGGPFCTKARCDSPSRACAGGDRCLAYSTRLFMCTDNCTVGGEAAMPERRLGATGGGAGCRAGWMCRPGAVSPGNSGCWLGNYNDVTTNNIGSPCEDATDCYSPFGYGECVNNFCIVRYCEGVRGVPSDICGVSNRRCVNAGTASFCVRTCTTANDCEAPLACAPGETPDVRFCAPFCANTSECRAGESCSIRVGETVGRCIAQATDGGIRPADAGVADSGTPSSDVAPLNDAAAGE